MTYSADVLALSPLAYWRLGDASGTTLTDSSGSGRNGTYIGSPTLGAAGLLTGDADTAVNCDGTNDGATVTDAAWMDTGTTYTAIIWAKFDTVAAGTQSIFTRKGGSSSNRSWEIYRSGATVVFNTWNTSSGSANPDPATVAADTVYMIVGVRDGFSCKLYMNGTLFDEFVDAADPRTAVATDMTIAWDQWTGAQFLDGTVDEAAFFTAALTATQIADLYTSGSSSVVDATVLPPAATATAQGEAPAVTVDAVTIDAPTATATAAGLAPTVGDTQAAFFSDAVVEIAFNSGYSTPAASRTWTDVSDYVEAHEFIEITYGRQDEFSTCDANTCRVTLDNSDGRFTARRASSPYYPNVKIGRPLRVTVTRPGGSASTRFVGYIDDWPLEWDGASNYAKTQITATSRMARLGGDRQLKSIVEEEILEDGPAAYYTLGEAEGATSAADSSGNSAASLTMAGSGTAVTFGTATGPGTDGLTAATFAGGKYLKANLDALATSQQWAECYFSTTATPATNIYLIDVATTSLSPLHALALVITPTGIVQAAVGHSGGTLNLESAVALNDGATHHVLIYGKSGATVLYVDGVSVDTDATAVTLAADATGVSVGGQYSSVAGQFTGIIAHAAVGTTALTAARAAAHANAGLTGFAGETPGARIERYATQAAVPLAEVNADAGTSPMAHVDTTGQSTMDMLRVVETTENGVLHDARDNTLRFHDRTSRYLATSAFTLSMTAQQIESGFVPKVDRTGLLNDVTATLSSGTVTARAVDQDSVDDYGRKSVEIELATTDENEPHAAAWSRVNTYAEPRTRIPAVSVDILPLTGTLQDSVLAADVGTRFAVTGIPSQAETTTGDFFVEGYTETIGATSHVFTFNVSDAAVILDSAFVLDSATRGVLDTNRLAY